MDVKVIEYSTREDARERNSTLIDGVFGQLVERKPDSLTYLVLELEDGRFVHIIGTVDGKNPITELPAFAEFLTGHDTRVLSKPTRVGAKVIGSYGTLMPNG